MEQKRILVVDDERALCDILLFNLRAAGYQAETAYSAEEALGKLKDGPVPLDPDLLLLDVMMQGMSGFELAKQLKEDERTKSIPIIFLTAKDTEDDTLQGFSLGADDYVTKPFSVREVMARVKAVLGRTSSTRSAELTFEGLTMDTGNKTVTIDTEPVALTRTEYDLLRLFLEHRGQTFTRQQLLDKVWPQNVIVKNAVQLHGGTITISTPDTGGLTFEFTLKTEGAFS